MDERKRALVVGINAYGRGVPSLGSAVRDAEAVAQQLELAHGYEVELLRDAEATVGSIMASLAGVVDAGLSEESSFVLYYAGHGIAADDIDGAGPQGFLLAHDAELTNEDTWLGMNSLRNVLDGLVCRHLMMVLDCCYAGAFRWASTRSVGVVKRPLYKSQYERYREGIAWQVLTSASHDEKADDAAPVTPDRGDAVGPEGHSPFAKALITALSGSDADSSRGGMAADGVITATELYQFIYEQVAVNDRQTPGLFPLKHENKGEFVFLVPGVELDLAPDPPLDDSNNPWPGLEAYSAADQDLFFGREEATRELVERVEAGGLVTLVGPSGSGKSSLIQAGILPSLERSEWTVVEASVAGDPKERLSAAQRELAAAPAGTRRLLVIDQFEQLFDRCDDSIRAAVIGAMRALLESEDCPTILIALRSDFEPRAAAGLGSLWTDGAQVPVPEFTPDDLRSVIINPAQARAVFFEPASIIDDLVHEVARMPGAGTLLSVTLADLYRQAQARRRETGAADRMLSAADYIAIGGPVGVLHRRASDLYDQEDDACRSMIRRLFLRLVAQDTDGLKRRRVDREELRFGADHEQLVVRALDSFVAARLLVVGSDGDREYVEPAHDALVVTWDKQLKWLAQSGSQEVIRDASRAARDWSTEDDRSTTSKRLWNQDPRLAELERRAQKRELSALEQDFCTASSTRQLRLAGIRRFAIATLAILTVVSIGASVAAVLNAREARKQTAIARVEAATALARLGEATATDDMRVALAAAAKGYGTVRNDITEGALLKLLLETRSLAWSVDVGDQVVTAGVPVGELAIFGTEDGAVSIVTADAEIEEVIKPRGSRVVDITVDAIEPVVAIVWQDGHVVLYDAGKRDVVFRRDWEDTPTAAAPYLDIGHQVVVAGADEIVVLDSAGERSVPGDASEGVRLRVRDGRVTTGAFFASETDLETADSFSIETGGNRAGVWDAAAGVAIVLDDRTTGVSVYPFAADSDALFASDRFQVFERELVPVDDVSLSGDGRRIALLSGSVLEVWSIGSDFDGFTAPQRVDLVAGVAQAETAPMRVELDDDGQTAITSGGSTIQRWAVGGGVVAPEFSPGGAMDGYIGIVVGDGEVVWDAYDDFDFRPARLDLVSLSWEFLEGEAAAEAAARLEPVEGDRAEHVSPDGRFAGRISGGVVTLVRLPERTVLTRLRAQADEGYLTFTEDGEHLIVASRGGGLQVWPLDLEQLCPELDRRVDRGTASVTCSD